MSHLDQWISAEFQRLAEIIQDYDPYLELRFIPEHKQTELIDKARPYCIWDTRSNSPVFFAGPSDTPVMILERLFLSDNTKHNVLKRLEAAEAAQQVMKLKEQMDRAEERVDFAAYVLKNKKNYWKHGGKKYDDEFREVK